MFAAKFISLLAQIEKTCGELKLNTLGRA